MRPLPRLSSHAGVRVCSWRSPACGCVHPPASQSGSIHAARARATPRALHSAAPAVSQQMLAELTRWRACTGRRSPERPDQAMCAGWETSSRAAPPHQAHYGHQGVVQQCRCHRGAGMGSCTARTASVATDEHAARLVALQKQAAPRTPVPFPGIPMRRRENQQGCPNQRHAHPCPCAWPRGSHRRPRSASAVAPVSWHASAHPVDIAVVSPPSPARAP
mmetsp:Transcript_566/g.1532  ORF Transcript_566/g.1532 Transcript_566/m.1532 type:complete len:219 (-) Transcript_566:873-1529(-)